VSNTNPTKKHKKPLRSEEQDFSAREEAGNVHMVFGRVLKLFQTPNNSAHCWKKPSPKCQVISQEKFKHNV
jgi:hypothetical protein